jgi:L-alanine-DL-glutamate epimerase-like enolase superfamily enzyme
MTPGPAVDGLEARVYTVPTDAPEADGTITWDSTTMVLVQVTSGAVSGLGWTYAAGAAAGVVHDALKPEVLGHGAFDVPGALDRMVRAVRNIGRPGVAGCAISAVDVALWDLKARLLDLPLHRLLGAVRAEVPVYGSGGFTAYDAAQLDHQLAGWVEQGIPRVKIKIGESWGRNASRDIARIRQTRSRVGDHTDIYVDANGGYSRKQAIRVMERARDLDVRWFEEPVSSDDLDGLRQVREAVLPDVAAGEYAYDVPYVRKMCQAGAVDCMQADATRIGGLTEWLRAAAVADSFGLHLSGHCAPHLHVAAAMAVPNLRHLEWFHDHVRIESMFFDGALDPSGGGVRPADDRPGLGLDLKESDAQAYRVA